MSRYPTRRLERFDFLLDRGVGSETNNVGKAATTVFAPCDMIDVSARSMIGVAPGQSHERGLVETIFSSHRIRHHVKFLSRRPTGPTSSSHSLQ
jgi:hypothetical protein